MSTDRETTESNVRVLYQQTDQKEQCVQFSTERETAQSYVYSSVETERPQTAKYRVQ